MSIRFKLYFGCFALTLVTAMLGGFAYYNQQRVASLTTSIYDEAFMAMSYLRSAQNKLLAADGRFQSEGEPSAAAPIPSPRGKHLIEALPDVLDDLGIATERALSASGRSKTLAIRDRLTELAASAKTIGRPAIRRRLEAIEADLDTAVEIYAGDGYRLRREVDRLAQRSIRQTVAAVGLSVLIGIVIMQLLVRAILPALGRAVRIAQSISEGKLDNVIAAKGRSETAQLLHALARMQNSIAGHIGHIEELRQREVSSVTGQLSVQHARFDAALRHMTQGLCLFDGEGRLAVVNCRFVALFGEPTIGETLGELRIDPALRCFLARNEQDTFVHERHDGRVLNVSRQSVDGGGWVATFEDVTERSRANAELAHMARHDTLTGLANRSHFRDRLAALLTDATNDPPSVTVLCLDLDGFKDVNDTLGHSVGDALLVQVADRLRDCVGRHDLVARLGGDEFAILRLDDGRAPDNSRRFAAAIVETLCQPFRVDGSNVRIGVSIGLEKAEFASGGAADDSVEALLKKCDIALYRAKAEGGRTYRFFETEMNERIENRRRLEADLRLALVRDEIEVFYQPFVDLARNAISGFEALVRWRHPERGMVSPAEFIPIAEELGLIEAMGAIVLRQACAQAANWPNDFDIAVNLSPIQFRNPRLVDDVAAILRETGLDPCRLQLEVTESVLLQDTTAVLALLEGLRELGARLSMDDFGTGYSSLAYLHKFRFDKIKIDQSFTRQIRNADNLAIVRAVIGLGRSMGIDVLAEGVETAEQAAILNNEGCSELQGYLFSTPRPAGELPRILLTVPEQLQTLAETAAAAAA